MGKGKREAERRKNAREAVARFKIPAVGFAIRIDNEDGSDFQDIPMLALYNSGRVNLDYVNECIAAFPDSQDDTEIIFASEAQFENVFGRFVKCETSFFDA
jgi:hypothetical protein